MQAKFVVVALSACAVCAVSASLFAGSLSPPAGPVAPTLKTMQEVEPRIAVNSVNTPGSTSSRFIISEPGSYYLTNNIIGQSGDAGIRIDSDDVTLDLNGFELRGVPGSFVGVYMPNLHERLVVRNGSISGWGFDGIRVSMISGAIEGLCIENNGGWGADVGATDGIRVADCVFRENGSMKDSVGGGMKGGGGMIVENCIFPRNSGSGLVVGPFSVVSRCIIVDTMPDAAVLQDGTGLEVGGSSVVDSSTININAGTGIESPNGSSPIVVRGCTATFNAGGNLVTLPASVVVDTYAP